MKKIYSIIAIITLIVLAFTAEAHFRTDILFLGDTSFGENYQENLSENILETKGYDYSLENFTQILDSADIVISNLETPITDQSTSSFENNKSYIHYSDPEEASAAFLRHNMTVFGLANNHIMDYGEDGLIDTFANLQENKFTAFGAGLTAEAAQQPFIYGDVAVIAGFEFREDYNETYDFYAAEDEAGVNTLSVEEISQQIIALRAENPGYFIVIFPHWGKNYMQENINQKAIAHALIDAGADLILGHGAHLMQGVESYEGKWIVYSLGNFMFNAPGRYQKLDVNAYSLMARLVIIGQKKFLQLHPIFTDNLETNYQSRFVTKEEFDEVYQEVSQEGITQGKNSYGYYFWIGVNSSK